MKRKKSKMTLRICAVLAAVCMTVSPVYAEKDTKSCNDTKAYSWYCPKKGKDGSLTLAPELSLIRDHRCFYVNETPAEGDSVIYLTFDAGYVNENVRSILDTLDAHQAKGAFFILDHVIKSEPELVCRMADSGHLVCNHTVRHRDMTKITDREAFCAELTALAEHYRECTGRDMPMFYRPPEGKFSAQNLTYTDEMGYTTVFWSFAYADWDNGRQPDCEAAFQKVMGGTHNGEILLLHPTSATNAAILDRLLTAWEQQGYRFGSLEELTAK